MSSKGEGKKAASVGHKQAPGTPLLGRRSSDVTKDKTATCDGRHFLRDLGRVGS